MRKISISARLGAKTVFFGGCIALPRSCSGAVVGCMPGVEFAPASSGSRQVLGPITLVTAARLIQSGIECAADAARYMTMDQHALLSPALPMKRLSVAVAVITSALAYRERRARRAVERFAAAGLETLLNAIEANDAQTGHHVRRVAAYALVIAEAAGLDERQRRVIERVALFHDIGKIHEALFDIVHDASALTPAERREIATHPRRGADVLAPLAAFYPELPDGVLSHHERWDGRGYPRRLRGEQIPLAARVVTIADTFDALTHNRRYRRGTGLNEAVQVIAEGRGKQFDPSLVDLILLPPVLDQLARAHVAQHRPAGEGRRDGHREQVPDVSFRWRSRSLRPRAVRVAKDGD